MSDQMQEIIGRAIARAYESGVHNERIKALGTIQALLLDAEHRLQELRRLRADEIARRAVGSPGYLRQLHEIKTEIKIYSELKERLNEQA